jgi:acyl-coenzyme A thioesterase PaaI-like protein
MSNDLLSPFDSPDIQDPMDDNWAARRQVSDATRRLIEKLVTSTADTDQLLSIAAIINEQADTLACASQLYGRVAFKEAGDFDSHASLGYELNPLDGKSNPIAAPIIIWFEGDKILAKVTMGWQYEGPPNSVHGGFVAALFDQFLGVGQKLTGQPGFTGTLSVKYIKPTPIATELLLEGRVDRIEGRKSFLVGEMWAGDVLTATCEGIFISVAPDVYKKLSQRKQG